MRLLTVGPQALLVEVADAPTAAAVARWARELELSVTEIVPAAETVLFDGVDDVDALRTALSGAPTSAAAPGGELVEIPVDYDGEDLAFVAERWGVDEAGAVELHTGVKFVSAFCGFSPGFAYLSGLPDGLALPRLETPRPRLGAGSVAVVDRWCGVYPSASPGGWRVLGHTDAVVWDVRRDPPALLAPGTRVRFVSA